MKCMQAGGLLTAMVQQLLCIWPFSDPGLALAHALGTLQKVQDMAGDILHYVICN